METPADNLTVALSAEHWKLIVFLTKRGLLHEMNAIVFENTHGPNCLSSFMEAFKALHGALPIQVAENLPHA